MRRPTCDGGSNASGRGKPGGAIERGRDLPARATVAAALALALSGCAGSLPAPVAHRPIEQVTPTMWAAAQRDAARLGRLQLSDAPHVVAFTISHDALCELRGRCVDASYVPPIMDGFAGRGYFSGALLWRSDVYARSVLVHEAAHSMQDTTRPAAELEREAYTIQAAWLDERGATSDANEVLAKRDRRFPDAGQMLVAQVEG